jgi:dihydroorotate dehydrogenase
MGAWINKIGLRNPGIKSLVDDVQVGRKDITWNILSLAGDVDGQDQWSEILDEVERIELMDRPLFLEVNLSCPNVGKPNDDLFMKMEYICYRLQNYFEDRVIMPVSVKIPPVRFDAIVNRAYDLGIRYFTCSNTMPVPGGGVSGVPQRMANEEAVRLIKRAFPKDIEIWACGGIYSVDDAKRYVDLGADRIVLGTAVFEWYREMARRPWLWASAQKRQAYLQEKIDPFLLFSQDAPAARQQPSHHLIDRIERSACG